MMELYGAKWIGTAEETGSVCPVFRKCFQTGELPLKAELEITAHGVYEAKINGSAVTDAVLMPGWTVYAKRLQVQRYDVTALLEKQNALEVTVGRGWYCGRLGWVDDKGRIRAPRRLLCALSLTYADGSTKRILSDASWEVGLSPVRMSELYDGETYNAQIRPVFVRKAKEYDEDYSVLIPHEGEYVRETQEIPAQQIFRTPKGELVIDFGQNLTGYVRFRVKGKPGDKVVLNHAEVMDAQGNVYLDNMRSAKNIITYICAGKEEVYKPHFSFQGFRYCQVIEYPGEVKLEDFTAVVIHSDMRRTGYFECSDPLVNRLFENVVWGQRGNFVDVPTDCPQRDERLGWTGDAQVFAQTASYIYDTERFYTKWLRDVYADQFENGGIPHVVPNILGHTAAATGWGDCAVIIPWVLYKTFGNKELLAEHFPGMCAYVDYMRNEGDDPYLWLTGDHYADWLGLDAYEGSYKGATDDYYIASAFYAYSTSLVVLAGKALGVDVSAYEELHGNIVKAFREMYFVDGLPVDESTETLLKRKGLPAVAQEKRTCLTQTGLCLALYFDLAPDKEKAIAKLAEMIEENGTRLKTGFLGTPYLLHVLSDNGRHDLACALLLQKDYPSWLYPVTKGATTMWEHWDGIKPDGSMWSADMNSFNHYAYGALADWMFATLCGIRLRAEGEGFAHIDFAPAMGTPLSYARARVDSRMGTIEGGWEDVQGERVYTLKLPTGVRAEVCVGDTCTSVGEGTYRFPVKI